LAPFYALLLLRSGLAGRRLAWRGQLTGLIWRLLPSVLVFAVLVLPYALWDFDALLDDVWRWSNGTASQAYQIWGWGASNFVLALGLVRDRFAYWPFWIPQLLLAGPALVWLLRRQWLDNSRSRRSLALRTLPLPLPARLALPERELPRLHPGLLGARLLRCRP
ncbi:hypothetical protein, partial [Candidatus Amarobacter glycogenicus]|uniref:hypothetical protein n=1 Tax=Candidatus Amarobacter glycogenicus TaxID=3140699 RepID=UPI002A0D83BB|nr:hypothetical protein [Dehalococcoidia bacterium]